MMDFNEDRSAKKSPDSLDEWLSEARWPESTKESLGRLEEHWKELSEVRLKRDKLRRRVAWAVSVAACLLIACCVWYSQKNPSDKPSPNAPLIAEDQESQKNFSQELPPVDIEPEKNVFSAEDDESRLVGSRAPTVYEKLVFQNSRRNRRPHLSTEDEELLESALTQIIQNPQADIDSITAPLLQKASLYQKRLEHVARRSNREMQVSAILLLGRLGSWKSIPLLITLNKYPQTHAVATQSLARLADPLTIGRLISQEPSPGLQQELLEALLSRRTVQSLAIYLHYVRQSVTSQIAFAALEEVADPPVELLFQYINSPRQVERIAAAKVLGRVKIPVVTRQLIQMAMSGINRQEALVALLNSSDEEALVFISNASHHPTLVAAVHSARSQLQIAYP